MGQFKPMVKMETTEPSVILKLKKGGHVASNKDENGHTNMKGESFKAKYSEEACEGDSPKKPSMSDRRKAMSGSAMKKGGKVEKKAMGGMMGAPAMAAPMAAPMDPRKAAMRRAMMARKPPMGAPAAPMAAPMAAPVAPGMPAMKKGGKASDKAQDKAMIKKAFKQHDMQEHEGGKGTSLKLKNGGKMANGGTIEGNEKAFKNTKMHDGDKADKAHGTGAVKMGKPAGYKTGGVIEGQPAGYKKGGAIDFENRPANTGDRFDPAHGTSGVRNGNAGGYKKGGATKKHFATGGSVEDTGRAVAMPSKPVSKPVSTNRIAGTFKKGGKVVHKAMGGVEFAPDQDMGNVSPGDVKDAKKRAMQSSAIDKLLGRAQTQKQAIHVGGYKKGGNAEC